MTHCGRSSRISGLVNGYISILAQWGATELNVDKPMNPKYIPYTHTVAFEYENGDTRVYNIIEEKVTIETFDQYGRLIDHCHKLDIRSLFKHNGA